MNRSLAGLVTGIAFGMGLALSDMTNPARVQAFLDVAGDWDPSLAYVMSAALVPSALAYRIRRRMDRPLLDSRFFVRENSTPDRQMMLGAGLFGIGWGLVGLCPGPAIASLAYGAWQPWLFVAAMVAGMALHRLTAAPHTTQANANCPVDSRDET